MKLTDKIKKGLRNAVIYSLISSFVLGGCATFPKYTTKKENKKKYELYLQYLKNGKPELKQFPASDNLTIDGIVTGVVVNNAGSAHIYEEYNIFHYIRDPLQKVDVDTLFGNINIMINDHNSGFATVIAGIDSIENKLNNKTLTYGHFLSQNGLPFSTNDFYIDFLNGNYIRIDQINLKKIKNYKDVFYLGNNKEQFVKENKEKLEKISKSYEFLLKFPNDVKKIIIYENNMPNACEYHPGMWMFTGVFEKDKILSVFEHEFLHNINGKYRLPGNENIVDYFLSISTKLDESLEESYRDMMITHNGWIVFGGLDNTGENKDFFDFISESNYGGFAGHPYSNSDEFVTSYIHSLFYPEIINEKLKIANEKINKLYFETGQLILDNLEKGDYRNFVEEQLNKTVRD